MKSISIGMLFILSLSIGASLGLAVPDDLIKSCDNSGAPNKKDEAHKCMCVQATRTDCDQKPKTDMPGCDTNCHPDRCKCTPEKCS